MNNDKQQFERRLYQLAALVFGKGEPVHIQTGYNFNTDEMLGRINRRLPNLVQKHVQVVGDWTDSQISEALRRLKAACDEPEAAKVE